jgi:hypothetical protein
MLYIFTDLAGAPIGSVAETYRAAHNHAAQGYETEAALQFFFPNVNTSQMNELRNGWWLVDGQRVHVEITS